MCLKVNSRVLQRYLQGAALIAISGLFVGCSSDVTRFTDGIYTGSTPSQQAFAYNPIPQPAEGPAGGYETGAVQSSELPPIASPQPQQTAALTPPPVPATSSQIPSTLPAAQESAPAKTQTKTSGKTYIVQSGDTLSGIARKTGTSVAALKQANDLNTDTIRIGQPLSVSDRNTTQTTAVAGIPVPKQKAVKSEPATQNRIVNIPSNPGNTGKTKTLQPEKAVASSGDTIRKAEDVAAITPQATGIARMRWPARGRIISNFGQREGTTTNDGMDIMVPEGTSVRAAENGVVIYADNGLKEFGNTILIRHEDNVVTVYGHNSKILVTRGQKIRRGDEIAKSGMSGNATTPRLHFEVRKNSSPVNPAKYLEK